MKVVVSTATNSREVKKVGHQKSLLGLMEGLLRAQKAN
jgi:hypothetical protein